MNKRILIITVLITIILFTFSLYQTFASSSTTISEDNFYDITLSDNDIVVLPKKSSKIIFYQICNTNKGKVQYGVGYNTDNAGVEVGVYWDSIDPVTGIMDYGDNKFIKLKLSNHSNTDAEVKLSTILGYEKGGDLILGENTLVTENISEHNYLMKYTASQSATSTFLRSELTREQIGSITFEKDNIVPSGTDIVSVPVAITEGDTSIMLWYENTPDSNGLYDVHIGSSNGRVSISSGAYLFQNMTNLTLIDFKYFDTSSASTMYRMFYGCSKLTTLDVGNFDTSNVTTMSNMFYGCSNLTTLDVSNFDTSMVENMSMMFCNCSKLTTLDVSNFDTSNVTIMSNMFLSCSSLTTLDVSKWNTSMVENMSMMFNGCSNLTSLDVSKWNTSMVENMSNMFKGCSGLTSLDVSKWNTSMVKNLSNMFSGCSGLTSLDVSKWNTSMVENMSSMFYECSGLATLDLSKWNTSGVLTMSAMFSGCSSLTSLDVSNFNTENVTKMGGSGVKDGMFNGCSSLVSLDLGSFITINVTTMRGMFGGCSGLQELDFSLADFSALTDYAGMFSNVPNTAKIYVLDEDQQNFVLTNGNNFSIDNILIGPPPVTTS